MGKNDTFNFIDGLFGGFAQGFQQARDRQSQKDLQERKFGLQEQQLGFNERQIALQEQAARTKAERAQRSLKLLEPFLQQFLGSGESSTQPSTTPDPVDTAQAATQAIQQPAPQPRQETFLPSEFPTTPEGVGTTSVRDRTVSDLVATEGELNKLLKQSTVKKPVESLTPEDLTQIQAAISEIEKNPTSLKQLKQARRLKELLQQRDQQTQEAENLPQVIERISQDLNIAPESRFGLGTLQFQKFPLRNSQVLDWRQYLHRTEFLSFHDSMRNFNVFEGFKDFQATLKYRGKMLDFHSTSQLFQIRSRRYCF